MSSESAQLCFDETNIDLQSHSSSIHHLAPPFNESVQWILFKEPMYLSQEQLDAFRDLRSHDNDEDCPEDNNWLVYDNMEPVESIEPGKIVNNFRPPTELGNRELREAGEH